MKYDFQTAHPRNGMEAFKYCNFKDFIAEHFPNVRVADLQETYLCWFNCRCFGMPGRELAEYLQKEAKLFLDDGFIFGPAGDANGLTWHVPDRCLLIH